MTDLRGRLRRVEERLALTVDKDGIDWPALFAHVAKHGKRLVDVQQVT